MCLIVHQPAGAAISRELLSAAVVHNPDGWGAMGFEASGRVFVEKKARVDLRNHAHGAELDGLWLSSTRWIDRDRFPLAHAPQPQERAYRSSSHSFV